MHKRTLALAAAALFALAGAASAKSKVEVTVKNVDGETIEGADVSVSAETGDPFTIAGTTDKKGRYRTEVPDFDRAYLLKVGKEGYTVLEERLDFPAQQLRSNQTAEVGVTIVPRGPTEVFNEGVRALQARDNETAGARFEEAVAMKPDFVEAWRILSRLHLMQNEYEQTLAAAEKTLALAPGDGEVLRDRYEALLGLGRKEEAAAALDALAAQDKSPESAKFLFNAGAAAWNDKDGETARKRFEQALAADPKLWQAHQAMAEIHIDEQNWDLALAEIDKELALTPRNFKAYERKIAVLKAAGKTDEATAVEKQLEALRGGG
ncbi:MAG: tetratricopeptide repeat protein [Acidobacteria bacterium]|nr:tetratricopeptide repeat protein [Acidobacteriota bacterium]MCB9378262.1 tetratricopeptide repeat protein [Holophagales bacterium]